MTGVELIIAALAAGATAGASDSASAMVRDAYEGLRDVLRRRLAGCAEGAVQALDATVADPAVWQARIGDDLTAHGVDRDEEILAAAEHLLDQLDPDRSRFGKYRVDLREAKGVVVGDQAVQINHFS